MQHPRATHKGPSWDDLSASYRSDHLWVRFEPTNGDEMQLMGNVIELSDFRSGSVFFVTIVLQGGTRIRLLGHCPHQMHQAVSFEPAQL